MGIYEKSDISAILVFWPNLVYLQVSGSNDYESEETTNDIQ